MFTLTTGAVSTFTQNTADSTLAETGRVTMARELYPGQEDGDLYRGLTWKLTFDRTVPPYGLEVTYDETTHIISPSAVRYVDLGSPNLVVGKANGVRNVIRVKAVARNFRDKTNISVITESGSFYTLDVKYAGESLLLGIEMKGFVHGDGKVNHLNSVPGIYLRELDSESLKLVQLIDKGIHEKNKHHVKHIGSKVLDIQYLPRGTYIHNGLFHFRTQMHSQSNVPFGVDPATFKIVDKKVTKRTAVQEQIVFPFRIYNYAILVARSKDEHTMFAFDKLTIPVGKVLVMELNKRSGGHHQSLTAKSENIVEAKVASELKAKQPCVRSSIC